MRINLDEAQLTTLETKLNEIIQTIKKLTTSIDKLAEEVKNAKK